MQNTQNKAKYVMKGSNKYKCPSCPYMTDRPSRLKTHAKAIHDKIRDFECPNCDFTTTTKHHLESHVKSCNAEGTKMKNPFFKIKTEKDLGDSSLKLKEQDKAGKKAKPKSDLRHCPFTKKKVSSKGKVALLDQCSFAAKTEEELTKHMKVHIKSEKAV